MAQKSVVSVYGVLHGRTRPTRLGAGTLIDPRLVLVKEGLAKDLADAQPPAVLRVGIGSNEDHPLVEVIEVTQTMRSTPTGSGRLWALELAESSLAPLDRFNPGASLTRGTGGQQAAAAAPDAELTRLVREHEEGEQAADPKARAAASLAGGRRIFCYLWPNSSFCP